MRHRIDRVLITGLCFLTFGLFASAYAEDEANMADPADVESVDAILAAIYDVISGPKGQERDWERFRSLFVVDARLIPTSANGTGGVAVLSPEGYWKRSHPFFLEKGFFEIETGRKVDRFGNIAQVFSAYEGRRSLEDEEPFLTGVNSIQLSYDGKRWWVVTIMWQAATPENPVPAEYLFADE